MKKLLSLKNSLLSRSEKFKNQVNSIAPKKRPDFEFQFDMGKVIEEPLSFYRKDFDTEVG